VARDILVWDQHCCVPLDGSGDPRGLARCLAAGVDCVSLNVGYAPQSLEDSLSLLEQFRESLGCDDRFLLARSVSDVDKARRAGQLAVIFDLEDANPLGGDPGRVVDFYDLGVRTLALTYNGRNEAGHGCLDDPEGGLTAFGVEVVAEMNRVGMVVDGSHCSLRTSLDLMVASADPVIFSHSSCRAVWEHERNVSDDQIRACAESGGVIGICGVGIFLGENDTSTEALVRHIDHAVQLVGPDHVGLGSDFTFDLADLQRELEENPHLFPDSYTRWGPIDFVPPERLMELPERLSALGYSPSEVEGIKGGGNFRRVAAQVWR